MTPKQFHSWLGEFNLAPEILITYLDRCRFDMVELGKEAGLKKGSTVNWFYGVMKKRGGSYPEPPGYKPLNQIRLEEEEKILREMKETAEKQERVRLELEFEKMLGDKKGELYQQCFLRINNFAKQAGGYSADSPVFRAAMLEEFKKQKSLPGMNARVPRANC